MTIAEEIIDNERSMLRHYAKDFETEQGFVEHFTDYLVDIYEGEIDPADVPSLTAKLQEFWREMHQ